MIFCLKQNNMSTGSFGILSDSVRRILGMRGIQLGDFAKAGNCRGTYTISLVTDELLKKDRFIINGTDSGAVIRASCDCALHAATGRLLEELRFDGNGGFTPFTGTVDFTPEKPLRGMYFATHFNNFYHNAPLHEVYEVIGDLALRGCNNLLVWFDMHHFSSMEDPAAEELTERLHAILEYANTAGMGGSLIMLSNEAFSSSPVDLRAEWNAQGGYFAAPKGHYHCEICPSKPGGIGEILNERRQMLSRFCDLKIDYVVYWPYDQGGCTCRDCEPWGANGYLKLLPHFRALIRETLPDTRLIVSSWYFDRFISGEWDAFYDKIRDGALGDAAYVMSFFSNGKIPECIRKNGLPDGVGFIDFPEISMYSCTPWGGFGASVLTRFLTKTNTACAGLYRGGFPYSEGVFEDANKYIQLMSYSGRFTDPAEALRSYIRFSFCCDDEKLYQAILRTETALARARDSAGSIPRYVIADTSDVGFVFDTLSEYNRRLPENITSSRGFRLFYLRALIDRELAACDFTPSASPACVSAMRELNRLYHVDSRTLGCVRPPVN